MRSVKPVLFLFLLLPAFASSQNGDHLTITAADLPEYFKSGGKLVVYTELYITNGERNSVRLTDLKVCHSPDSQVILLLKKDELAARFSTIKKIQDAQKLYLPPGESAIIYLEMDLAKENLRDTFTYHLGFNEGSSGRLTIQKKFQPRKSEIILGPPLRSGPWTAVYGPSWERGHRRVIYNIDGNDRIPGRFAIDFIKVNEMGKYADGVEDSIKNWFGYNADVLAVADGVVSSVRSDFPESPTLSAHPDYSPDKATGNFVSIKIGNNRFAFYEHLKPGSIRVKAGQSVKKGDIIASLGFTGQTTGPHLHFHVADNDSPLGAEGIPFMFERFTIIGEYNNLDLFGKERWPAPTKQKKAVKERPAPNVVIQF